MTDLGVQNKFYDSRRGETQRWSSIERPCVYYGAGLAAVCLYICLTVEEGKIQTALTRVNQALLELGEVGLYQSAMQAIPLEHYLLKLIIVMACCILLVKGLFIVSTFANRKIDDMDSDAKTHTASQSCSYAQRVTVEQYELTKMEHTRKQLEKLTASKEYQKFMGQLDERPIEN